MRSIKKGYLFIGLIIGVLFVYGTIQSDAANLTFFQGKYAKSQEVLGKEISRAARLQFHGGKVQESLGQFIQTRGPGGNIIQEDMGSGIAAAAHIRWELMLVQESLGLAIMKTADIVQQNASLLAIQVQERLREVLLTEAQIVDGMAQEGLGGKIALQAQLNYAGGLMASALYASLQGKETVPIPNELFRILRKNRAFDQLSDFGLAVTLLEKERGLPLSLLLSEKSIQGEASSASMTPVNKGWGGFLEFGLFSVIGFLFSGWAFSQTLQQDKAPRGDEEMEAYEEYQHAA